VQQSGYRLLYDLAERVCGLRLDDSKAYLLDTRLAPICKALDLACVRELADYVAKHRDDRELERSIVQALTTNETWWLRDPWLFDWICKELARTIAERRSSNASTLRVWCAAASSGQEPYSLIMSWLAARTIPDGMKLDLLATDYDQIAIERGKLGRYSQLEVGRGLPARMLIQHFEQHGKDWQLSDAVMRQVKWDEHNLLDAPSQREHFDLALCRNVLIYFSAETKQRVLDHLIESLAPQGVLVLGGSESLIGVEHALEKQVYGKLTVYVKSA